MKKLAPAVLALCLGLTACSNSGDESAAASESSSSTVTSTVTVEETTSAASSEVSDVEILAETYGKILDNPFPYLDENNMGLRPDGTYSYALHDATGDGLPELFFRANGDNMYGQVRIASSEDGKNARLTENYHLDGQSPASGATHKFFAAENGDGFYITNLISVVSGINSSHYRLEGNTTVKVGESGYQETVDKTNLKDMMWVPVEDRGWLDGLANGAFGASADDEAPNEAKLSGVVKAKAAHDIAPDLAGKTGDDPNEVYYVLELDKPKTITYKQGCCSYPTEEVTQVFPVVRGTGRTQVFGPEDVDKRVKITAPFSDFWLPGDPGMPTYVPRLNVDSAGAFVGAE
ncbi:hypothetical protein [Corynebacterium renale]|uniref:hypothetical protein n=1 Tax=Corynebacterium renale TaxID=1724 RepID=UPI0011AB48A4|nr:hypothetical protein [Corynebacterium renale]